MKKCIPLFLILITALSLQLNSQTENSKDGAILCSQRKSSFNLSKSSALSPITPKHSYDVLKYTLNLDIYDCFLGSYPNSFSGSVIVKFKVDSALNTVNLDARNSFLVIDNVGLAAAAYSHINDVLSLTLDHNYQPGDTVEVKIDYHHLDIPDNAFYASGGFVFTDCEPEKARNWFPCWDKPSDKALLDLTAKVPLNVKLGSNGALQDSTVSGDSLFYHWVSRDPVATYLIVMTAKVNYNLDIVYWTNPNDPQAPPTPIRFYYNNNEDPTQMEQIITGICDFFSETFCDHPFEKNGFATLNNQFSWGGMENQTLTSLCPNCWYESVFVHEFAHQWFGDMITCGTWADIFLNEGFATYLTALWYGHSGNASDYKAEIDDKANDYLGGNPGWPISQPSWAVNTPPANQLFNYSITYAKGACVLHLLRYVMGDSSFFAGMKSYASDTVNIKYQSALIADFVQHMEAAYGQPLDWFFNEWIYEPNHPVYANTFNITNQGNGTWKVGFFARQTQTNTVFFKMPIQIRVKFTDNSDTILRVMNDQNNQAYSFYFTKQPNQVIFDPGNQIVLKSATTAVGIDENSGLPEGYSLTQNFPNPANDRTEISYSLPGTAEVSLSLYDVSGKKLTEERRMHQSAGEYHFILPTAQYEAGVYFYRYEVNGFSLTRRMIIAR
ncbi:MAG: M1 family aminopeptidase [Bacteroidales bacterium]